MISTFIIPVTITCAGCKTERPSLPLFIVGEEAPMGLHYDCTRCGVSTAVVPDGTVICTLKCEGMELHPCN